MPVTPNYAFNLPTVGGDLDTWGTLLNTNWSTVDTALDAVSDRATALESTRLTAAQAVNLLYPVGAIYISVNSVNPGTLWAGTTWVAKGQGRALVGVGSADGVTWTVNQIRGTATVTLDSTMMPAHTHSVDAPSITVTSGAESVTHTHTATQPAHSHAVSDGGHSHSASDSGHTHFTDAGTLTATGTFGGAGGPADAFNAGNIGTGFANITVNAAATGISIQTANPAITVGDASVTHTHQVTVDMPAFNSVAAGGGLPHDNIQPSIAVFIWERTA